MGGQDVELRPQGLTGARLIGIVLVLLVLLVGTLGVVEWINHGAPGEAPAQSEPDVSEAGVVEAGVDALP